MSYIGNEPVISAVRTITEIVATNSQSTFTANGGYTVGYLDVFVNGAQLTASDFTATNGTTVVLNDACVTGDIVRLVAWGTFNTGNINGSSIVDASITQAKVAAGVSGTGPAFSAYQGTSQTLTSTVYTKIALNTERFDTNNNFDSTTNYRFTPTVAGYYQINYQFYAATTSTLTSFVGVLYKNGATYEYSSINQINSLQAASGSSLVYMNGTTDYLELYLQLQGTGTLTAVSASGTTNFMSGSLVRAA